MMSDQIFVALDTSQMQIETKEDFINAAGDEIIQELSENSLEAVINVCDTCKKIFDSEIALQNHRRFYHMSDTESDSDSIFTSINAQRENLKLRLLAVNPCAKTTMDDLYFFENDESNYVILLVAKDQNVRKKRNAALGLRLQTNTSNEQKNINGPFKCSYPSSSDPTKECNLVFYDCCLFSLHFREEHTKRRKAALRCQVCEKRLDRDFSATTMQGLTMDISNFSTFSCRPCGVVFFDEALYDEHNKVYHVKYKPYQCPICAKRFTQQGGLQQHVRAHSGLKPFSCTFCPKAFTQKAGLDQHLRTHTKVKPFKCVICAKCFSQSVHLRQHMRTHTNIQPFECNVCGRKFKQSSHLTFHMRSHSQLQGECLTKQNDPDDPTLSQMVDMRFEQVEHGGAVYYSARLPHSLYVNENENANFNFTNAGDPSFDNIFS